MFGVLGQGFSVLGFGILRVHGFGNSHPPNDHDPGSPKTASKDPISSGGKDFAFWAQAFLTFGWLGMKNGSF